MTPKDVLAWLDTHLQRDDSLHKRWAHAHVQVLSGGLLNHVWRVQGQDHSVIVKYTPNHIASAPDVALSAQRSIFEAQALRAFEGLAGPVRVPKLLAQGLDPHVLVMEDIGQASDLRMWLDAPTSAPAEVGAQLGRFIGDLHARTWEDPDVQKGFDNHLIQRTRFQMQYQAVGAWGQGRRPRAQARAFDLGARLLHGPGRCMIMGDLWPSSVLVGQRDLWVIDWEMCHFGQPLQDVAHLAAHLWMLHHMHEGTSHEACALGFVQGYRDRVQRPEHMWSRPVALDATAHMGIEVLARLLGPFGSHYGLERVDLARQEWMQQRAWEMVEGLAVHPWLQRLERA